jgi:hypothetical protein
VVYVYTHSPHLPLSFSHAASLILAPTPPRSSTSPSPITTTRHLQTPSPQQPPTALVHPSSLLDTGYRPALCQWTDPLPGGRLSKSSTRISLLMSVTRLLRSSDREPTVSSGMSRQPHSRICGTIDAGRFGISFQNRADVAPHSAATNQANGEGVAIKKVTNVFSKKILAKRALRELKLLQHFRGMYSLRGRWKPTHIS